MSMRFGNDLIATSPKVLTGYTAKPPAFTYSLWVRWHDHVDTVYPRLVEADGSVRGERYI